MSAVSPDMGLSRIRILDNVPKWKFWKNSKYSKRSLRIQRFKGNSFSLIRYWWELKWGSACQTIGRHPRTNCPWSQYRQGSRKFSSDIRGVPNYDKSLSLNFCFIIGYPRIGLISTVQRSLYTVSLLHFARDFNNHINTHGLYWETWSARNGNDNMVDIKEGISDVDQFKWLALYDTFKPIIAMYFADGAEKPLDNFIETVTMNKSFDQVRSERPNLVQEVQMTWWDWNGMVRISGWSF